MSFPSFHQEKCLNPTDLSSQQPAQSQSSELHKGQGQADKLKSLSSTEKTCRGSSTDQGRPAPGADTEGVSGLDVSPKPWKVPGHSSSAQPSAQRALGPQQHTGTAQDSRAGRRQQGEEKPQIQTHHGELPAEEPQPGSAPGAQSHEEKVENQSEAASALDSCPMCLMQFTGR